MVGNDARAIGVGLKQGTSLRSRIGLKMLKSTEEYFQVMVAVDDGSLPASIVPETQIFICNKKFRNL
jgi:hypothetical protein